MHSKFASAMQGTEVLYLELDFNYHSLKSGFNRSWAKDLCNDHRQLKLLQYSYKPAEVTPIVQALLSKTKPIPARTTTLENYKSNQF